MGGSRLLSAAPEERGLDGGRSLPQSPRVQPPNSHLCGLAFQAWSGISNTTQPLLSLSFKEAEALETETKLFEDLEFQQLEQQSRAEEERELASQGLLLSKAELLRSVTKRKVCPPLPAAGPAARPHTVLRALGGQ